MEVGQSLEHKAGLTSMKEKEKEGSLARENLRLQQSATKTSVWQLWSPPAKVTIRRSPTSQQLTDCVRTLLSQVFAWSGPGEHDLGMNIEVDLKQSHLCSRIRRSEWHMFVAITLGILERIPDSESEFLPLDPKCIPH